MAGSAPPRRNRGINRGIQAVSESQQTTTDDWALNPIALQEVIRKSNIKNAWDALNGIFPDSILVKSGKNQKNFNIKANLHAAPLRQINAFLFGQDIGIEVKPAQSAKAKPAAPAQPPADDAADPAQTFLDEFWEFNHKMMGLQEAGRYGSVTGDSFLKIVVYPGDLYPTLVVVDPQTVEVETLPDNVKKATKFTIKYQAQVGQQFCDCQQVISQNPDGQAWLIQDYKRPANRPEMAWQRLNDPQPWLYPFPPIFHAPNTINPGSYHGAPDVTPATIHLNIAYNFILSNLYKAAHFFGNPRTIGHGFKKADLPADPDDVLILPSDKSTMSLLDAKADIAGGLLLAKALKDILYSLLSMSEFALGDLADIPKGQVAAMTIELLFQPLTNLMNEKRLCYGQMISDVCSAVLQIGAYGINRRVKLNWQNPLPIDYLAAAQAAVAAEQAGMSQQTALETILRVDWDIEQNRQQNSTPSLADTILSKFNTGADLPGHPAPGQPTEPPTQPAPTHPAMIAQQVAAKAAAQAVKG